MIASRWVTAAICLSSLLVTKVQADEGWKFPSLNPFKKSDESAPKPKSPSKGKISDGAGTGSSKFWESKPAAANASSNQPSTWDKMSTGTKNLMGKTKSALTPWKTEEPAPTRPATGTNRFGTKKQADKGWFSSASGSKKNNGKQKESDAHRFLFPSKNANKKDEKNPQTVPDWLDLPRPE